MILIGVTGTFEQSKLVLTNGCACPGDTLTYKCSVMGEPGGATVWFGNAFNCESNESVLFHRRFTELGGTLDVCNNGAIVAQSLSVNGNMYTSQLNVTLTSGIAGKTIMCTHDPLTGQCQSQTNWRLTVPLSVIIPGMYHCHACMHYNFQIRVCYYACNFSLHAASLAIKFYISIKLR